MGSVIKGGNVAKNAKEQIEKETGKKFTSSNNKNIKGLEIVNRKRIL